MEAPADRISAFLREVARAHHRAYVATDGEHAGWAAWYAERLAPMLEAEFDLRADPVSLASELIDADVAYRAESPAEKWPEFYAARLAARVAE